MRGTVRRSALAGLFLSVTVVGVALGAVTWQTQLPVPGYDNWSGREALARSSTSAAAYQQVIYSTNVINNVPVSDSGPYQPVLHRRLLEGTNTWSPAFRLTASGEHGDRGTIAAAGRWVVAAWVSIDSVDSYDPAGPRRLHWRANGNSGDPSAWGDTLVTGDVCTPGGCTPARIDRASMTVGTSNLLMAYTDGNTGEIILSSLSLPFQGGTGGPVATTTATNGAEGFAGEPSVARSGSLAVLAWRADNAGTIRAMISTNGGGTWGPPSTVATGAIGAPSADASGGRAAVSWVASNGIKLRIHAGSAWGTTRTAQTFGSTLTYKGGTAVAVDLVGGSSVGVAYTACRAAGCSTATGGAGIDVLWRESSNNGMSWFPARVLSNSATTNATYRRGEAPSVDWPLATQRSVLFTRSSHDRSTSRVLLARGNGTP
jgi:hypothetical protein